MITVVQPRLFGKTRSESAVFQEVRDDILSANASAGGQLTISAASASHDLKESSEFKSNRFNFSEVSAPLRGSNGARNAGGLPDDKTFVSGGRIKDKIRLSYFPQLAAAKMRQTEA